MFLVARILLMSFIFVFFCSEIPNASFFLIWLIQEFEKFLLNNRNGDEKIENANRLSEESYDAELKKIVDNGWKYYVKGYVNCHEDIFNAYDGSDSNTTALPYVLLPLWKKSMLFIFDGKQTMSS